MQFKIMTFNVRGSFNADSENTWDKRRQLNIATIQKYEPDIIGFQEAQMGNLETYRAELTAYDMEQGLSAIRDSGHHEHVPLYWKRARFEKINSGGFHLSPTPDVQSIGWDAVLVRPATWVKLRERASDTQLLILNTHFPHQQDRHATRTECAKLVIRQLDAIAPNRPAVAMGDFNALPESEAYKTFCDNGYVDSYRAAGHQEAVNTYHGYWGANFRGQGVHIDWILTRNGVQSFSTVACDIVTDAEPPLYPSDHYPVLATLTLE